MSMTFTVTASVGCDPYLGKWISKSHLHFGCHPWWWHSILSWFLPRGGGLVELCLGFGQTYPEGVLQLAETETVLTFWSTSKMTAMIHLLGVAMAWCDKPIRICIHPPTSTHIRDYIAARGRHPYDTQTPCTEREMVTHSPPVTTAWMGGPIPTLVAPQWPEWCPSQASNRGYLPRGNMQGRDSPSNGATYGLVVGTCWGVDAELEDEEVSFQGGEDGDPTSHHSGPQAPLNSGGCWSPPQHTCGQIMVGNPKNQHI